MKKVDAATLTRKCRYYEDIPEILDYISTVVKQGMDFLVELNRLTERHVMEIHDDRSALSISLIVNYSLF